MQEETNNRCNDREKDPFFDYFRDNLENHRMPVDNDSWDNIWQNIKPAKNAIILKIALITSAAAAAIILAFLPYTNKHGKTDSPVISQVSIKEKHISGQSKILSEIQPSSATIKERNINSTGLYAQACTKKANEITTGVSHGNGIDATSYAGKDKEIKSANEYSVDSKSSKDSSYKKDYASSSEKEFNNVAPQNNYNKRKQLNYKSERHNGWELCASVGTGNEISGYDALSNDNSSLDCSYNYMEEGYPQLLSSNIIDHLTGATQNHDVADYAPPFSAGILLRKKLEAPFSLETGLVYSFLSTTFRGTRGYEHYAKLNLNYIGIPINVAVNILNISPECKVYLTAGPMVEKGIKSYFSERTNRPRKYVEYEKRINGLQWSLNASAGISYRLAGALSFYIEPRMSYYFDNDQPTSIRTEKRNVLGINSGFRFDFGD